MGARGKKVDQAGIQAQTASTEPPPAPPVETSSRSRLGPAALVVGAIVVGLLVWRGTIGADPADPGPSASTSPTASSTATPSSSTEAGLSLEDQKRATVIVTADPTDPRAAGWGSGTIVSTDGLILTNAHVAANRAPGLGRMLHTVIDDERLGAPTPTSFYIYTVQGDDPAQPAFRADLVLADGYLDLAVLRITAHADGTPIGGDDIGITPMPLGSIDDHHAGDPVTVLGFPGIADSFRVHVSPGHISNRKDDELVGSGAWINSADANIAPGNSGGPMTDAAGRIVGISDQIESATRNTTVVEYVFRPIDYAQPLLQAAASGSRWDPYTYVTKPGGKETAKLVGISAQDGTDCDGGTDIPSGSTILRPQVRFRHMVAGDHVMVQLYVIQETGTAIVRDVSFLDWPRDADRGGCWSFKFSNPNGWADGTYGVAVRLGPNYATPLDAGPAVAVVGGTAGASPGPDENGTASADVPSVGGDATNTWLTDIALAGRTDLSGCAVHRVTAGEASQGIIAQIGCDLKGTDGVGYFLFGSSGDLDRYVADLVQTGRGNRTDVCGSSDGTTTWNWKDSPDVPRGVILCSDGTVNDAPWAFVQWTEKDWRIFGNLAMQNGDVEKLYRHWRNDVIVSAP